MKGKTPIGNTNKPDTPASAFRQLETGNIAAAHNTLRTLAKGSYRSEVKHLEARVLEAQGKRPDAAQAYKIACQMDDTTAGCFLDFAKLMKHAGSKQQAREILHAAFKRFPQETSVAAKLGLALLEEGHISQARKIVEYALKLAPDDIDANEAAGILFRTIGAPEKAVRYFERAIKTSGSTLRGPADRKRQAVFSLQLAEALKDSGNVQGAEATLRSILSTTSLNTRAWLILSDIVRFKKDTSDVKTMTRLLADQKGKLSASNRIDLGFAVGKAWMDIGDTAEAMKHLKTANRLYREQFTYDVDAVCRRLENYGKSFAPFQSTKTNTQDLPSGNDGPTPIFIVGMPRSGTTLIEQILATHKEVFGADELTTLPRLKNTIFGVDFPDAPNSKELALSPKHLSVLADAYRQETRQHLPDDFGHYRYLIDKMPGNFMFCGLISTALPDAKIIHCRRNPIDTCLSCFSKYFVAGQRFSYDLKELGTYYRAYEKLMSFWREVLPSDRFIEIQYEDVVADTETEIRSMTDALGLSWEPALLSFHSTNRPVKTASANQVRQPIYRSSVERWRPYEKELAPLFDALGVTP